MKTAALITASAATLLFALGSLKAADTTTDPNIDEAKKIIKQFGGQLVSELKTALDNGGPVRAINVCSKRAPAIADGLSKASGWEVGRTSLKVRNTERGTPDAWELEVLKQFEVRKAAGESVETMAHAEVVETATGKAFRFMKPVATQELCLTCHGTEISSEVATALDQHYPKDQARGFALGDIRGAFTLSKPL
jgi:hypothetical protein